MKEVHQAIEIRKMRNVTESVDVGDVIVGMVPREAGVYQLSSDVKVKVCPVVKGKPFAQKLIFKEGESKRRSVKLSPATGRSISQDINPEEKILFKIVNGKELTNTEMP